MVVFPVLSLTLATLRFAEFGFLGFMTKIWEQTALRWGQLLSKGDLENSDFRFLGGLRRMLWLSVRESEDEEWNKQEVFRDQLCMRFGWVGCGIHDAGRRAKACRAIRKGIR
jgi:hypothetical protein